MAQLLAGTILDGRAIETVPVGKGQFEALVIECDFGEAREAWRACREVLADSQRWPIYACEWGEDSLAARLRQGPPKPLDDPQELVEASVTIDRALALLRASEEAWDAEARWGAISYELGLVAQELGSAPSMNDAKAELSKEAKIEDVKNWLFRWQLDRATPAFAKPGDATHMAAFDPSPHCATGLALLPTPHSWESLTYLDFYGCWTRTTPAITVLRSWHTRFGAELWANYSTMLEFVVERPPSDIEPAWELAVEHERFAPCTTLLPGVPTLLHARSLIDQGRWHLHERP